MGHYATEAFKELYGLLITGTNLTFTIKKVDNKGILCKGI